MTVRMVMGMAKANGFDNTTLTLAGVIKIHFLLSFITHYFYNDIRGSGSKNDNFCLFWAYFYVEYVLTYGGGDSKMFKNVLT